MKNKITTNFNDYNRSQFAAEYTQTLDYTEYVAMDQAKKQAARKAEYADVVAAISQGFDFAFTTTITAISQLKVAVPVAIVIFGILAAYKFLG